jgi:alpha-L-fucosidase 2
MDAYVPPAAAAVAAVIVVHGGCWTAGDRHDNVAPLFDPLTRSGFAWFTIDYRLASDIGEIGNGAEDVAAAIRFVRDRAHEYNVDPNRIALVGESAGAHLAALAALAGPEKVGAVVSLYGPHDLEHLVRTSKIVPPEVRAMCASGALDGFLQAISPIRHVHSGAPPFLLIHGTADHIVPYSQSVRMHQRLIDAGVDAELLPVPGACHGIRHWRDSGDRTRWRSRMTSWLEERVVNSVQASSRQ